MKLTPRPYQYRAHDAAWSSIKTCLDPVVIELATGAGKSLIGAMLGDTVLSHTGKRVLMLVPNGELAEQNGEKMADMGIKYSLFSASVGKKSIRHPVVIGTPGTVKNQIERFGAEFAVIIIDECHEITATIIAIIDAIRAKNPNVRVIGMTATPYRLGTGYIYKLKQDGTPVPETQTKDPYFTRLVERVTADELLELGFLTPVKIGTPGVPSYDTSSLKLGSNGKFTASSLDQAYNGHGRKTSLIVADVVAHSQGRDGVMLFCATVQHAKEAFASLPPEISAIVTGETDKAERKSIVKRFKARKIKYLVNVGVFTRGFDAPHVSVIALLRKTESASLLQQIIGRGLRLSDGKDYCLLLDYSDNLESHFPDGNIFDPDIKVGIGSEGAELSCKCPECSVTNTFSARKNPDCYDYDEHGYFLDLSGVRIETEYGPTPAHYGRRCLGSVLIKGVYQQCTYRWTFKECPHCQHPNDIAARYCKDCKGEIIDPNEKLRLDQQAFDAKKRDASQPQTDRLVAWAVKKSVSTTGKEMHVVSWKTEHRTFETYTIAKPSSQFQYYGLEKLMTGTKNLTEMPKTISYKRPKGQKFFEILGFNREVEDRP